MENLSIAQHHDTLHYARICSGVYRPQLRRFWHGDYVYLQREAHYTLDEGSIAKWFVVVGRQRWLGMSWEFQNYVSCHVLIECTVQPELVIMQKDLPCFVCREKKRITICSCVLSVNMVGTWHTWGQPLFFLPFGQWSCLRCQGFLALGASTNHTQWSCVVSPRYACPNGKWWVIV